MSFQILLNVILAITWMALQNSWTIPSFIVGFIMGMVCLYIFRRFWPNPLYTVRLWAVLRLLGLFAKELLLANVDVMKRVIHPRLSIRPGIIAIPLDVRTDFEITVLANLITLTPGTMSVDVSNDNKLLYIHALYIPDAEKMVEQIKGSFERSIMEVTRPWKAR